MNTIAGRIAKIKASIAEAAERTGRDASSVSLILVTKTVDAGRIREAYNAGHRDFGENRVQELAVKAKELPGDIRWHMIGHLQTNKVKPVLDVASVVHSVDSIRLAEALSDEVGKRGQGPFPVMIQVNTSGEDTKFGLAPDRVLDFVRHLNAPALAFRGLMTIGPLTGDESRIRKSFRSLRELIERLRAEAPGHKWRDLSMGMTSDYKWAIDEGATVLRIGSAVFGERP